MARNHLVIGDPHAKPGVSNERFTWLGKFIVEKKPEIIVCMGDMADMESLSSYDRGKKDFEGRRYQNDIAAVQDALAKIQQPMDDYNAVRKRNKEKQYKPKKYMIVGNHEERIDRAIQLHPELEGTFSIEDLDYERYGWHVQPYRCALELDGIYYCHYFPTGVSGEPISGVNVAQGLLGKNMVSCVVGHNHIFDYASRSSPGGRRMHALSVGCYFEHTDKFATAIEHLWWRGLVYLKGVCDGDFDVNTYRYKSLKERYGNVA